jgi:type I restriction enzyme S subunit
MSIAATVGRPVITGFTTCIHDGFVSFERLQGVDREFLYYVLKSLEDSWSAAGQTGSQTNVNTTIVAQALVRIPTSQDEQRRIANVLADGDDLISTLEKQIAKKQAIKQGMMQELLDGRKRLPGFTAPWALGTFEDLASPSRERAMPQNVLATTPLVDLDQIEGRSGRLICTSQASEAVSLKAVFKPGDVLFGKLRAYLRKFWYAETGGLCTTEIWVLRAKPGAEGRFVRYIVETDQFIDVASGAYGTHMPRSDWGAVRALPVAIPPHDEQVAIASVLGDVDDEIGLLRQRLAKARDIKQGMMQGLLTGRTRLPAKGAAA